LPGSGASVAPDAAKQQENTMTDIAPATWLSATLLRQKKNRAHVNQETVSPPNAANQQEAICTLWFRLKEALKKREWIHEQMLKYGRPSQRNGITTETSTSRRRSQWKST
jgi:hypothetical protein